MGASGQPPVDSPTTHDSGGEAICARQLVFLPKEEAEADWRSGGRSSLSATSGEEERRPPATFSDWRLALYVADDD
jgi:hypothetical protein